MNSLIYTSKFVKDLQESIVSGQAPEVLADMMEIAVAERASDIHVEPLDQKVRVRLRIDGKLHTLIEYGDALHKALVSRVKVMSNLKIDEHRKPQDGRIHTTISEGKMVDIRVSVFPTIYGEKVVMRIIDHSFKIPNLSELGLEGRSLAIMKEALEKPNGIILNTGPTGSGKSTTLYACLNNLNNDTVNILTLEDPVENQMSGLNQSQVHPDIGYTFATGLRNALRQDPDIMMVGEIRDKETLETSIEAALTGHLVLSTLHTNSAIETITRLLNMQVPRYLITSTVQIIIAQRLVRVLCQKCKIWTAPSDIVRTDILNSLKTLSAEEVKTRLPNLQIKDFKIPQAGTGCSECSNVGYKGRLAIYEILKFTDPIQQAILQEESTMQISVIAAREGTTFLRQDGIIRVLQGLTSLEEVYANT
ncbi:MAG: GspE/PulE family protein [Candidatus Gracilibacteria bacterium]